MTTPWHTVRANSRPSNQFEAPPSNKRGLFGDVQHGVLPVSCTAKAAIENKALLNWVCNQGLPSDVFVLCAMNKRLPVSAFLQDAMVPALLHLYNFVSMKTLGRFDALVCIALH